MKRSEVETKHILHIPTGLTYPVIILRGCTYDMKSLFILAEDQSSRQMINLSFHYSMSFETFLSKCSRVEGYTIVYDIIEFEAV